MEPPCWRRISRERLSPIPEPSFLVVKKGMKASGSDDGADKASDPMGQTPVVQSTLPDAFSLEQNYPNPFNPVTTISYSLPVSQRVTLTVFDVLGREVARLVDGRKTPGRHEVVFDASTLPSGVYLYRLEAGPYIETKKLLLAK